MVTTSWDDGHPSDLKLAEMLSEYGLDGTFYIAPRNRERVVMAPPAIRDLGHSFEVGAHSMTHPDLRRLKKVALEHEVNASKAEMEDAIGEPVRMFCYPRGLYNRRVRAAVVNAGFRGARTTREFSSDPGRDAWQMATTIMGCPLPTYIRLRHEGKTRNWRGLRVLARCGIQKSWDELAIALFERTLETGGVWHLWGHSWQLDEQDLWEKIERVFRAVSRRDGVTYLTNSKVLEKFGVTPVVP